ncbi:hypothetical protein FB446DRAFT_850179 [Lentinula raphanica]|nr:hypothetical protein FB446DRAFT_850179 [Lentinula raphanica]
MTRSTASRVLLILFVGAAISSGVLAAPAPPYESNNYQPLAPKPDPSSSDVLPQYTSAALPKSEAGPSRSFRITKPEPKPKRKRLTSKQKQELYDELSNKQKANVQAYSDARKNRSTMTLEEQEAAFEQIRKEAVQVQQDSSALPQRDHRRMVISYSAARLEKWVDNTLKVVRWQKTHEREESQGIYK